MKRPFFAILIIFVIGTIAAYQYSAMGQSTGAESDEALFDEGEADTFSNQPIDHRYRMIQNRAEEYTIFAIAEKSRMEKKQILRMLTEVAKQNDLDPALLAAVATQESMLNPEARSHMGAMGLMQLMPATARNFGVKNILDPRQNAEGGAKYIRYLMNEFNGNIELVLAAYNAGVAPVQQYNAIPPFGQTQAFVERVLKLRDHYKQVLE